MKFGSPLMKATVLVLIASVTLSIGFTNCAKGLSTAALEDLNIGLGELPEEPVIELPVLPTGSFKAGDPFTRSALGTMMSEGLKGVLDHLAFESATDRRAIAIAINGLFYASVRAGISAAENDRLAVEGCNLVSGTDCALIASEGRFVIDADELAAKAEMIVVSTGGVVVSADVPLVTNVSEVEGYLATESTLRPFKALALSLDGSLYYQFGSSQSEANRRSLARCEFMSQLSPCLIYAEGNRRAFSLANWDRKSVLRLAPSLVKQDDLPFVLDADRGQLDGFFKTIADGYVGVLAIGQTGTFSYAVDVTTEKAREKAVASCRTNDPTCFVFSEMKEVSLRWDTLDGGKNLPREWVCGIPRASCQEHRERGCGPGPRWIRVNGQLGRASCL